MDRVEPVSRTKAVLLDFYGTVAGDALGVGGRGARRARVPARTGDAYQRWYNDGIDGIEHDEHSQSRDHYVAWQRQRTLAMLAETDVHPGEYEEILEKLRAGSATRTIEAYDEAPEVLDALRARGLRLVICSNWDWDLREAIDEAGLTSRFDAIVSSAWVGARKPHPRIYATARSPRRAWTPPKRCSSATPGVPTSRARSPRASPRSTSAATGTGPTAPAHSTSRRRPRSRSSRTCAAFSTSSEARPYPRAMTDVREPKVDGSPADLVKRLRATFDAGRTRPAEWRRAQLHALKRLLAEGEPELIDALAGDLGKSAIEGFVTEIAIVRAEIDYALAAPRRLAPSREGARPDEAAARERAHPP